MEITLSIKNKKQLREIENIVHRMGISILNKRGEQFKNKEKRKEKAWTAIRELQRINAFSGIDDPVKWQDEQRKDRNIGWDD